jgi:hypothetical protein
MQVKKILFTKCLFILIIMLVKYVLSDGISQAFLPFRFADVIVITDHDLFWNVGQANCILKYFENMTGRADVMTQYFCILSVRHR